MSAPAVDIEEIGFDRPCTKEVHGSLGSLDVHLIMVRVDGRFFTFFKEVSFLLHTLSFQQYQSAILIEANVANIFLG